MRTKPQSPGTPVRRSHPLAAGLVRAWVFNGRRGRDASGWTFRDAAGGDAAAYTRNAADTAWADGPAGPAFQCGADGSGATWEAGTTLSRWGVGATPLSVVARVASFGANPNFEDCLNTSPSGFQVLTSRRLAADADGFTLLWQSGAVSPNTWNWGANGSGQFVGASWGPGSALAAGRWYTAGGTYQRDPATATYGGTWSLFVDGLLRARNNLVVAGSFGGTFADRVPRFHGPNTLNTAADKRYDYVYVWNRALSPGEVAWVTDEPFGMFARRRVWDVGVAPPASAGGATPGTWDPMLAPAAWWDAGLSPVRWWDPVLVPGAAPPPAAGAPLLPLLGVG